MPQTDLHGPHSLTSQGIDAVVKGIGPGAYALGRMSERGALVVERVGRSDTDLNDRLHDYIENGKSKYPVFKYGFFDSPEKAFYKECHLFHDFKPRDNPNHPDKPDGTNLRCPVPHR